MTARDKMWHIWTTMPVPDPSVDVVRSVSEGANIWIAASDGDLGRVRFLLEHGDVVPTSADAARYTPIHAAASYAKHDVLYVFTWMLTEVAFYYHIRTSHNLLATCVMKTAIRHFFLQRMCLRHSCL